MPRQNFCKKNDKVRFFFTTFAADLCSLKDFIIEKDY